MERAKFPQQLCTWTTYETHEMWSHGVYKVREILLKIIYFQCLSYLCGWILPVQKTGCFCVWEDVDFGSKKSLEHLCLFSNYQHPDINDEWKCTKTYNCLFGEGIILPSCEVAVRKSTVCIFAGKRHIYKKVLLTFSHHIVKSFYFDVIGLESVFEFGRSDESFSCGKLVRKSFHVQYDW